MHPHRSSALGWMVLQPSWQCDTQARSGVGQCHSHGLGLISLRAARERLHPRMSILRAGRMGSERRGKHGFCCRRGGDARAGAPVYACLMRKAT